ncbi:MAG: hypothetical protein NVS9B11_06390 [Candidatus Dormibacteraceae bacterium]
MSMMRNEIGKCLARPGLGLHDNVTAGKQGRNSFRLDLDRFRDALCGQSGECARAYARFGE